MGAQPTDEELLGHHLVYEIDQMACSLIMLGRVRVPEGWSGRDWRRTLNNSMMESFYLHARALFEFFKKSRGARKYAEASYQPFKGVNVSDWVRKLNNQAAHLLDGRTADDTLKISDQDRFDMVNALAAEVRIFQAAPKPDFASIVLPTIPTFPL
jgi:hypothetical protein